MESFFFFFVTVVPASPSPAAAFLSVPGCLPLLIEEAAAREGLLLPPASGGGPSSRAPLWVSVDGSDPPTPNVDAISVNSTTSDGGVADLSSPRDGTNGTSTSKNSANETDTVNDGSRIMLPSGASIPYDVMIGISIGGFRKSSRGGKKEWALRGAGAKPVANDNKDQRGTGSHLGGGRRAGRRAGEERGDGEEEEDVAPAASTDGRNETEYVFVLWLYDCALCALCKFFFNTSCVCCCLRCSLVLLNVPRLAPRGSTD